MQSFYKIEFEFLIKKEMTNDNSEYKCNRIRENGSQCSSAAYSCDGIYADGPPLGDDLPFGKSAL